MNYGHFLQNCRKTEHYGYRKTFKARVMRWRLKLPNRNHLNLYAKNHYSLVLVESGPKAFYRSLFEPFNISVIAQYVVTFKYLQIDQCNVYMLKMSNKLNLAPGLTLHLLSICFFQTLEQFEYDGCDNCEKYLRLKNNKENILTCTSANFDG